MDTSIKRPPAGVISMLLVCSCMAVCSFILGNLSPPEGNTSQKLLWIINSDMFEIQNLGHSAFLLLFATSWWRNNNVLGVYMSQLSSLFFLSVCVGFILISVRLLFNIELNKSLYQVGSSLSILFLFTFSLVGSLILTTRRDFSEKYSIFSCVTYSTNDKYAWLRRLLLIQMIIQVIEPIIIASARITPTWSDRLLDEFIHSPAFVLKHFMESYTLAFHQAFVMSTAFSQVILEDHQKNIWVIMFSVFGQLVLTVGFLLGGVAIPADFHFKIITSVKITVHTLLAFQLFNMTRIVYFQGEILGRFRFLDHAQTKSTETGPAKEDICHKSLWGIAIYGYGGYPEVKYYARIALFFGVIHGLCWQIQSILSVFLTHHPVYTEFERASSLRNGLNFGMHGAGITVFDFLLCFRNLSSWRFMQFLAVFGCFGGAISSIAQVFKVNGIAGISFQGYLVAFFALRAIIGILFGISLLNINFPDEAVYSEIRDESSESSRPAKQVSKEPVSKEDETCSPEDQLLDVAPEPDMTYRKMFQVLCLHATNLELASLSIYWVSVVFYSCSIVAKYHGGDTISTGLWQYDAETGGGWRLLEFAPGYLLLFHFGYILLGFALHWFVVRFEPSRWIAIFFAGSSMIVAGYQAHGILDANSDIVQLLVTAASALFSLSSAFLIRVLYYGKKTAEYDAKNIGDFWH